MSDTVPAMVMLRTRVKKPVDRLQSTIIVSFLTVGLTSHGPSHCSNSDRLGRGRSCWLGSERLCLTARPPAPRSHSAWRTSPWVLSLRGLRGWASSRKRWKLSLSEKFWEKCWDNISSSAPWESSRWLRRDRWRRREGWWTLPASSRGSWGWAACRWTSWSVSPHSPELGRDSESICSKTINFTYRSSREKHRIALEMFEEN